MERELSSDLTFLLEGIKEGKDSAKEALLGMWPILDMKVKSYCLEPLLRYYSIGRGCGILGIRLMTIEHEKAGETINNPHYNYDVLVNYLSQVDKSAIPKLIEILCEKECCEAIRMFISDILLKLDEPAKYQLINEWEKTKNKNILYALDRFNWEPQNLNDKLVFFETFEKWEELIKIGEKAVAILSKHDKWTELIKMGQIAVPHLLKNMARNDCTSYKHYQSEKALCAIGEPAIPILVDALKDSDFRVSISAKDVLKVIKYLPKTNEEKLIYFLACDNWEELANLGTFAIPSLIDKLSSRDSIEVGKVLVQIGENSVPYLCQVLKRDHRNPSEFVVKLLLQIGGKVALLAVLEALPSLNESTTYYNSTYNDICKLLINVTSKIKDIEVKDSINKTTTIFFDLLSKGHLVGEMLHSLGADEDKIVNGYIIILKRLERPIGYIDILKYFAKHKSRQALKPLFSIIDIPKPGRESFYKDIVKTIGEIGDKSAIPSLRELLNAQWKKSGTGSGTHIIDSKWIEPEILNAIQELSNISSKEDVSIEGNGKIKREKQWWRFWN